MFGGEQRKAFQELKERLASAGYFDKEAPTQVIADTSPVGLRAVLTQRQKDGPRVISYASRSLTDTERRYSQTEKEALALVWACEKFHPYVYDVLFELVAQPEQRIRAKTFTAKLGLGLNFAGNVDFWPCHEDFNKKSE